jgi:para-aminobenzoate synthetase/4-amino-4-deoxychorismate lyase
MQKLLGPHTVILSAPDRGWLLFRNPVTILCSRIQKHIIPAIEEAEKRAACGEYAAGFVTYEAAPAFDGALVTHQNSDFPLFWFGIFRQPERLDSLPAVTKDCILGPWHPDNKKADYLKAVRQIKTLLAAGETYQVNYTLRMQALFEGEPFALFHRIIQAQKTSFGAYLDLGDYVICSASPELFFHLDGSRLISRPMKGTAHRGRTLIEDRQIAQTLAESIKDRAENIMITDMMRNDIGRVAITGTVETSSIFHIEKFQTVWQMTSTVRSGTSASVVEIFRALFPCASVTGAPKPRTMEIIRNLEANPRKIYTGAIGLIGPGRSARFSVAIRTVLMNRNLHKAEYGVGGGIVWDSVPGEEYQECLIKTRILTEIRPAFQLLESMLWTQENGFYLLDLHLKRMEDSASYFDYPFQADEIQNRLCKAEAEFPESPLKIRLLLDEKGSIDLEQEPVKPSHAVTTRLAKTPVDDTNIFLYHKTTNRDVYIKALSEKGAADDVILWNNREQITEASSSNIVVKFGMEYWTPPVTCGLLPGTRRAELIGSGKIKESVIPRSQLIKADRIYLINSVRPWREAVLID